MSLNDGPGGGERRGVTQKWHLRCKSNILDPVSDGPGHNYKLSKAPEIEFFCVCSMPISGAKKVPYQPNFSVNCTALKLGLPASICVAD